MSRRTEEQMIELSAKVVSLSQANPTLSDAAIARHFNTSPSTVAAILKRPNRVEPEDTPGQPSWVDRHSVNCYFCGKLFDEREGYPADEMNGGDGGTACPQCYKNRHDNPEENSDKKTDSKGRDISKVPDNFGHHVVLYAKNWHGRSGNPIADLKAMLSLYAGIDIQYISDRDIYGMIASTFAECVHNQYDISEAIMEMIGKKWAPPFDHFNGTPEGAMLGKLSIVDGCYCDPSQMLKI